MTYEKNNFYNRGQSLIGIIIVLVAVGLIAGGFYYYLQKQIPEIPEITKKSTEEEMIKPEEITPPPKEELLKEEIPPEGKVEEKPISPKEEAPVVQKCADGTPYGQCSATKPKYCDNGNLINKCSICSCSLNYYCDQSDLCELVKCQSCQSGFFQNDPVAQSIIEGNNYQLKKDGFSIPDKKSFDFKIINAFRQLGYARSIFAGSESFMTFGLHTFQKSHNLPITDFVDKSTLLLIDSELFQREKLDKKLAEQYPPFAKFIEGPANEPSKEHLAALYSSFFTAMPKNIYDPAWTIDEFRSSLVTGLGANLGKMMNREGTRVLLLDEMVKVMNNKDDFRLCSGSYYWGLDDNTCNKIEPTFGFSSSDYSYMALLLAHEYGHETGRQSLVVDGQTIRIDEQFGKISFYKSNGRWFWVRPGGDKGEFVSEYARTAGSNELDPSTYIYPDYNIPVEDFAESFTAYIFQGNIFRERVRSNTYLQQKYDFLKKYIFHGSEYNAGSIESLNVWESNNSGIPFHPSDYLTGSPDFVWDYKYPLK